MSPTLPYVIRGGFRTGAASGSWPFAKLEVSRQKIRLQFLWVHSDFVLKDILSIKHWRFLVWRALVFTVKHPDTGHIKVYKFYPWRYAPVIDALRQAGFTVENDSVFKPRQ